MEGRGGGDVLQVFHLQSDIVRSAYFALEGAYFCHGVPLDMFFFFFFYRACIVNDIY